MSVGSFEFAGKTVVVTGGSSAIGAAACRAFAEAGARVVVSGRNRGAIDQVVQAIRWGGDEAIGVAADVTDARDLARLRGETEAAFGAADIVLAFAGGLGEPSPTPSLAPDRWRASVECNLTGTFLTVETFLPAMLARRRGAIVTMASSAARVPSRSNAAYAAAKAGVVAFTRHLANELGPCGVRVNCVSPSAVRNERMRAAMTEHQMAELGASFPLGRVGEPDDVAEAALYLASDSAGWVTGVVLDVAGGGVMV